MLAVLTHLSIRTYVTYVSSLATNTQMRFIASDVQYGAAAAIASSQRLWTRDTNTVVSAVRIGAYRRLPPQVVKLIYDMHLRTHIVDREKKRTKNPK